MNKLFGFPQVVKSLVSLALVVPLTACNEFEPSTDFTDSGKLQGPVIPGDGGAGAPIDTNVGMESLSKDIDAMELSIQEVEAEIAAVDLPSLISESSSSGSGNQSVSKKLRGAFTKLYDSIALVYGKVKGIRTQINEQLAKLDPSNPLHAAALIKLREYMTYLDDLEAAMSASVIKIAQKVDESVAKIEGKIAEMDMKNPLTWGAMIIWEQTKSVFFEFRDKLLELAKS